MNADQPIARALNSPILEVCAGSLVSAINAQRGGAQRIELCENLNEGGTTPSSGTLIMTRRMLSIPVFVLVRPRIGDFRYSAAEFEVMKQDILHCKAQGADGVVMGILNADGSVDTGRMAVLVEMARPMQVTFHRAFDGVADPFRSMEEIIDLGIDRILTSGQAASAPEGAGLLQQLISRANNRIIILAGGGITEANALDLIKRTGAGEIHASLRSPVQSGMLFRNSRVVMGKAGLQDVEWMETDPERVAVLIKKLEGIMPA